MTGRTSSLGQVRLPRRDTPAAVSVLAHRRALRASSSTHIRLVADDNTVKVWDYQTKQCVQTMEGHTHNVATVCCHPELPIIMSGSEDGTIKIWHATTYRLENTLNYAFERCWSIAALKGTNNVAIGYDEGTIAIQLGNEDPIASMDASGKIIMAKHNEISVLDLKKLEGEAPADGERLALASKELDVCEICAPQPAEVATPPFRAHKLYAAHALSPHRLTRTGTCTPLRSSLSACHPSRTVTLASCAAA